MASNTLFTVLGIITSPKSLSLHFKQINKIKNKLDGQPSSLLTWMQVSDYPDLNPTAPQERQAYRLKKIN